jgi:hypothetical protein
MEYHAKPAFKIYKRIVCTDGFNLSVQAGFGKYCTPRIDYDNIEFDGLYTEFEVGFPSSIETLLEPYGDQIDDVCGYVPVKVIVKIIRKHGGIPLDAVSDLPPGIAGYLVAK